MPATVNPLGPTETNYTWLAKVFSQDSRENAYHSWPSGLSRQFLRHETIYEGAINHQAD